MCVCVCILGFMDRNSHRIENVWRCSRCFSNFVKRRIDLTDLT